MISSVLGKTGPVFITLAMILFAFTTLLGNLYYCDNALAFMNNKKMPSQRFMNMSYIACVVVIFVGELLQIEHVWSL